MAEEKKHSKNDNLHKAKAEKNDEFYTQREDIEKELSHYKEHFRDKRIYCCCDDPFESEFAIYFALNFKHFGLKSLTCTCYGESKIAGSQMTLEGFLTDDVKKLHKAYSFVLEGDVDINSKEEFKAYLRQPGVVKMLKGNGDFRSDECKAIMRKQDIVVTNPPFSLFREFVAQLEEFGMKYLIIGNMNAITYKEIFPLIKENKLWLGYNSVKYFIKPDGTTQSFGNILWYTNLDIKKRHENIILYETYTPEKYPYYDNYDAIEVSKVKEIPVDYLEEVYEVDSEEELEELEKKLKERGRRYKVEVIE